jgi:2,4-dienoyl-CoA reductase-like NADH-dependent reductase (Old Yellow Enzyme family)
MKLNDELIINSKKCKNRIVMPPLVCFAWADENGYETVSRSKHYGLRAEGTGLIVVEATAISKEARLGHMTLGLWEDGHIQQFADIAKSCQDSESLVIVQLVHAGFNGVTDTVFSSSEYPKDGKKVIPLTLEQIQTIKSEFVAASVRAYKAGLDGVEIHGAHTYLLNQFTASQVNKRTDRYGGSLSGRFRLPLEIVQEVREATSDDFIIAYRFGVNDETFKEDIKLIQALDVASVDFFNVSIGFSTTDIPLPSDFPYHPITYMGVYLKRFTNKPMACVFGIKHPETAHDLIERFQVPMVAVGKGLLADPNWSSKALKHESVDVCFNCKPRCKFGIDGKECPYNKINHYI